MKINSEELPSNVRLHSFDSRETLTRTLAGQISVRLIQALESRGNASIAVSGGSTPVPLFRELSQTRMNWPQVNVTLADERWVNPDDDSSNEKLVRNNLLQHEAANARFSGLWSDHATPSAALDHCNETLSHFSEALDVVILGMGNDGHTASLFPCSDDLDAAVNSKLSCAAVTPGSAPHDRMTLTPQRLLNSELRILHVCGEDKLETLKTALADNDYRQMPIRLFLEKPLDIFWAP